MTIPYAGKDPDENRWEARSVRAYRMFQNGKDTLEIARHFGVKESTAHRWIGSERSSILGLPNPYEARA